MTMAPDPEPEYYSVALIGSSGGGTATLGHTDPVELLTTIHRELLRIRDNNNEARQRRRRVCVGISHAIFVSLSDGSGFDSIRNKSDWLPDDKGMVGAGPRAALYSVGFNDHDGQSSNGATEQTMQHRPSLVRLLDEGPLTKINRYAQMLDETLSHRIRECHQNKPADGKPIISALISLSSEPTHVHSKSLSACNLPVAGSGGTSLSQIASLYDLRIVGNSGGSVASTTVTKARGWAMGLAREWGMVYDEAVGNSGAANQTDLKESSQIATKTTPVPTLKSILEAALPTFLFVCIALHSIRAWDSDSSGRECIWDQQIQQNELNTPTSIIKYALRHVVIGTTLCILTATSRSSTSQQGTTSSSDNSSGGDQSTLLMSATIAGVISSASASQSIYPSSLIRTHESFGGGSAMAGLVAGAIIPSALNKVSYLCHRYHVTATMTNILCGGGVGMLVGMLMHVSGLAHGLGLITGAIRSLLRWRKIPFLEDDSSITPMAFSLEYVPVVLPFGLVRLIFPILQYLQEQWCRIASVPSLSSLFYELPSIECSKTHLPLPMGLGFLYGCIFVYGSKIGWYHSIFLPLILLEMDAAPENEEASLFGAIDECTLCMVCAGICAGNLILPSRSKRNNHTAGLKANSGGGHASLAWQALKTNILCGDFIEAAYPSMERSRIINVSAYLAAGLSTEILLQRRVLSTAYFPLPLAMWISNDGWSMSVACLVAFVVSLAGTLASNIQY